MPITGRTEKVTHDSHNAMLANFSAEVLQPLSVKLFSRPLLSIYLLYLFDKKPQQREKTVEQDGQG